MDSLRAIFPNKDPESLRAALEAHNNSVERTVEYLLTADPPIDMHTRHLQETHDEALARRLQAQENATYAPPNFPPPSAPAASASASASALALPSLQDVSNAVRPIVNGVADVGRAAAQHVSHMYNQYIAPEPQRPSHYSRVQNDDTVVLRGQPDASPSARSTARRRSTQSLAPSSAAKKDS